MSLVNQYLDAELVEQLNQLQLAARSVVEGSAAGLHRSPLRGSSVEFRQHRAYVPGDEPRRLDWRVLARTNRPFVKEYDEETNLRCLCLLDCSGSMKYGSENSNKQSIVGSKFEYAARLTAALSYLMLHATESVGLATMGHQLRTFLPPRGGSRQLSRVIDALDVAIPAGAADIKVSTAEVAARLGRRALVIVISDFLSPTAEIRSALARLRHDRHELICLRILHRNERDFPFEHWALFQGLEGEADYLGEPALLRKQYLARFEMHARELSTICRTMSADFHTMLVDEPLNDSLFRFLKLRSGRR